MTSSFLLLALFAMLSCETRFVARNQPIRSAEWNEPLAYLEGLTDRFSTRLDQYGPSNLLAENFSCKVNGTRYNIELVGEVNYRNGEVIDFVDVTFYTRDYKWYFDQDLTKATIFFKTTMVNTTMTYDLSARLEVADVLGHAALVFPENLIDVYIVYNMTTGNAEVATMRASSVKAPLTNYTPDSDVMRAIAYDAHLTLSRKMLDLLDMWIEDVLREILEDVIQETTFPMIQYI